MTTSLADLLLGVDMEGGESFCDSVYNFLKNQGKDINLLTNSGFGVWSQSDANKGLGTLVYDNLAIATFEVGEAITTAAPPGGSGATGKVITNIGTTLVLGACVGRFNDNEQITGADSGATADVNMPDAAAGVDLLRNGEFEAGVGGWTAGASAALASVGAGKVGNCLSITDNGENEPYVQQNLIIEPGKIYKFICYIKAGTEDEYKIQVYDVNSASFYLDTGWLTEAAGDWSTNASVTFEANPGNTNLRVILYSRAQNTEVKTIYFDEISLYEITPCCTGADGLAPEGWEKQNDPDLYREHSGTNTKDGSFYSLAIVPTDANASIPFPPFTTQTLEEWYMQFRGRPITAGVWVNTSVANHLRIATWNDVTGYNYSSYHTGGGAFEWLEVTATISATATRVVPFLFICTQAGDVDGSTIVYASQPMLVFGWSLGEGMYQPRLQEKIWLETQIPSALFNATAGFSTVGFLGVNLEADSDAMLPKGAKETQVLVYINDSGSLLNVCFADLRDVVGNHNYLGCSGLPNGTIFFSPAFFMGLDPSGDYGYNVNASGAGTFDFAGFFYKAIQVN